MPDCVAKLTLIGWVMNRAGQMISIFLRLVSVWGLSHSTVKGTLMSYPSVPSTPAKSKTVAALLAFFLGGFGAPDFYLGYKKVGIIKLVVWAVGMILYMPGYASYVQSLMAGDLSAGPGFMMILGSLLLMVVGVWALVTFIQVLIKKGRYATDANGQPLA